MYEVGVTKYDVNRSKCEVRSFTSSLFLAAGDTSKFNLQTLTFCDRKVTKFCFYSKAIDIFFTGSLV